MEHDYGATSASDERLILQLLERAPGFVPTYREHRRKLGYRVWREYRVSARAL